MAINYEEMMAQKSDPTESFYTNQETMLYALGVGMGRDPMNTDELPFVYERDQKTIASFATVMVRGRPVAPSQRQAAPQQQRRRSGVNQQMVVHGEQRISLHKPLPPEGEIVTERRLVDIFDKGEGKGAILINESITYDKASGDKLVTSSGTTFARGDGGFGGPQGSGPTPHAVPTDRKPDFVCDLPTDPGQALIYRLNGDRNPLHSDPEFASKAGFPRPILHGLCTYGVSCYAVLKTVCNYDDAKILGHEARFSSPVFPGETIRTEMWVDDNIVSFECKIAERDVTVIKNGKTTLAS